MTRHIALIEQIVYDNFNYNFIIQYINILVCGLVINHLENG